MPLISVIIPVYNGETTIQATIDSVLQQTFPDFELIVINDASTDETLAKVGQYTDTRLRFFTCSHQGASASRNQGLNYSIGEYIAFLDADDLWTPDKLEAQFRALRSS